MADREEELRNQQTINDLRGEELGYIQESYEFLSDIVRVQAELADIAKINVARAKTNRQIDKEISKAAQENVNALRNLKVDYSSIKNIQKDREKIDKQLIKNQILIGAKSKELTKEQIKQAKQYNKKENIFKSEQKLLEERIAKEESISELAKRQKETLGKVDPALRAQLNNAKQSRNLQQSKVAGLNQELQLENKMLDPMAKAVAALEAQNDQLQKGLDYLKEEENALNNIQKGLVLWDITLGAVNNILKKIGLESAAVALGLEDGQQAAQLMAEKLTNYGEESLGFIGKVRVLAAGVFGTIKSLIGQLGDAIIAAFSLRSLAKIASKVIGFFLKPITFAFKTLKNLYDETVGYFNKGISFLKEKFFSIKSFVDSFTIGEQLFFEFEASISKIATGLGVATQESKELFNQANKIAGSIGMLPEDLLTSSVTLQATYGATIKFADDTVKTFGQLTNLYGMTNEEAAKLLQISDLQGKKSSDQVLAYKTEVQALKQKFNVAVNERDVLAEIANSSAATQLTLRGQGKSLADAAFQAKRLGLEMDKVNSMGESLLDFENSITKEMTAELMLGRDLNLERAREAALRGDAATVARELATQMGSASEFQELNILQQKALAEAVGMTRDELADSLKTQELLADTGFKDMSSAQESYNKALKETGSEEKAAALIRSKGASEALTDQLRQVSAKEQETLRQRELVKLQMEQAMVMRPVALAFRRVLELVEKIRVVLVKQMGPFFDAFAGMVDKTSGKLQGPAFKAAVKFGKALNDIGLAAIRLIENHLDDIVAIGTAMGKVFTSVFGLFGRIANALFNTKREGEGALDIFSSIERTFLSIANYIDNINVESIVEGALKFAHALQNAFNFVVDASTKIGKWLYEHKGMILAIAGIAGIAVAGVKIAQNFNSLKDAILGRRGDNPRRPIYTQEVNGRQSSSDLSMGLMKGNIFKYLGKGGGLTRTLQRGILKTFGRNRIGRTLYQGIGNMGSTKFATAIGKPLGNILSRVIPTSQARLMAQFGTNNMAKIAGMGSKGAGVAARFGATKAAGLGAQGLVRGASSMGRLAGGPIGILAGLAAELTAGAIQNRQLQKADVIDQQLLGPITESQAKQLKIQQESFKNNSAIAGVAKETAKYTAMGAGIGVLFGGVGAPVGAVIGAVVGAGVGVYKEYRDSAAMVSLFGERVEKASEDKMKAFMENERKILRSQARTASNLTKAEIARDYKIEQATAAVQKRFLDLGGKDLDYTSREFRAFAEELKVAGYITEDQFNKAVKGSIEPLDLMNAAASGAATTLNTAFNEIATKANEELQKKLNQLNLDFAKTTGQGLTGDQLLAKESVILEQLKGEGIAGVLQHFQTSLEGARSMGAGVQGQEFLAVLRGEDRLNAGINQQEAEAIYKTLKEETATQLGIGPESKKDMKIIDEFLQSSLENMNQSIGYFGKGAGDLSGDEGIENLANKLGSFFTMAFTESYKLNAFKQDKAAATEAASQEIYSKANALPTVQTVNDAASISNNGPFTIQDSRGNLAVTHPSDKLVVSPNVSYVNDGVLPGKKQNVFPVSEKFGALDVQVGKGGVMVQKVSDAMSGAEILDSYPDPSVYVWNDENIQYINRNQSLATLANRSKLFNDLDDAGILGLTSHSGYSGGASFAGGFNRFRSLIRSHINQAIQGDEKALDYIVDPYQPNVIRNLIKNYGPIAPESYNNPLFYPDDVASPSQPNKAAYNKGYRGIGRTIVSNPIISQTVEDAVSPTEILKQYPADSYVWNEDNILKINKRGSLASPPNTQQLFNHLDSKDILGLTSTSGYRGGGQFGGLTRFRAAVKQYLGEAIQGDRQSLDYIIDPYKPERARAALLNFNPRYPSTAPLFYPDDVASPSQPNKAAYNKGYRGFEVEKLSDVRNVEDGIIFNYTGYNERQQIQDKIKGVKLSFKKNLEKNSVENLMDFHERISGEKLNKRKLKKSFLDSETKKLIPLSKDLSYDDRDDFLTEGYNRAEIDAVLELRNSLKHEYNKILKKEGRQKKKQERINKRTQRQAGESSFTPEITQTQLLSLPETKSVINNEILQEQIETKAEYTRSLLENVPQIEELPLRTGYTAAPTHNEVYEGNKFLRLKMQDVGKNTLVRDVQTTLKDLYSLDTKFVDGFYGGGSRTKMKTFQSSKGLARDGVMGGRTYRAMFKPNEFEEYLSTHPEIRRQKTSTTTPTPAPTPASTTIPDPSKEVQDLNIRMDQSPGNTTYDLGMTSSMRAQTQFLDKNPDLGKTNESRSNIESWNALLEETEKNNTYAFDGVNPPIPIEDGYFGDLWGSVKEMGSNLYDQTISHLFNPEEFLKNLLSDLGESTASFVKNLLFSSSIKNQTFSSLSKKVPVIGKLINAGFGAYDVYEAINEKDTLTEDTFSKIGKIAYELLGSLGGGMLGSTIGVALSGALGVGTGGAGFLLTPAITFLASYAGSEIGAALGGIVADYVPPFAVGEEIYTALANNPLSQSLESPQQVADGSAFASKGPFTITDKFGATAVTAKGDGVVVSPNISYVEDGITNAVTSGVSRNTTVINTDNSKLEQKIDEFIQVMSKVADRDVVIETKVEMDAREIANGLSRASYNR